MALLFADGFDSYGVTADFPKKGWENNVPADTTFESVLGRDGGGCVNLREDNANLQALVRDFTLTTEVFRCAFWCNLDSGATIAASDPILKLNDSAIANLPGTVRMGIVLTSGGLLAITEWDDGAQAIIGSGGPDIRDDAWHHVELHYILGDVGVANGTVEMWVDGVKEVDLSAFTNNLATGTSFVTHVKKLRLAPPGTSPANIPKFLIDDLIVWDDTGSVFTGAIGMHRIETIRPTSEGNTIEFTPSSGVDNSALIDEVALDIADYVEANTSTNKDTYGYADLAFVPTTIHGLVINTVLENPDIGDVSFKTVERSVTTETDGASVAVLGHPILHQQISVVDPNTAAAWTGAGVDAAEFGFKVV